MPFWLQAAGIVTVVALVAWYVHWSLQRSGEQTLARNKARWDREDEERSKFLKSAKLLRAKVLAAYQEGLVDLLPSIRFSLMVQRPEGDYKVEVTQTIEPTELHRFSRGSMVDVFVDPENRERVVLSRA
jgi:hypothetical protein